MRICIDDGAARIDGMCHIARTCDMTESASSALKKVILYVVQLLQFYPSF